MSVKSVKLFQGDTQLDDGEDYEVLGGTGSIQKKKFFRPLKENDTVQISIPFG